MRVRWTLSGVIAVVLLVGPRAHAIVLRYQPKVGEVVRHRGTVRIHTEESAEAVGSVDEPVRPDITITLHCAEKAVSETESTTRRESRVLVGKITREAKGRSRSTDLPSARVVVEVDRLGQLLRVVEADSSGAGEAGQAGRLPGSPAEYWCRSPWQFLTFPERDVGVDDSWSGELKLPTAPGGPETSLRYTSRLLALTSFQGRKCAKIRTSFEGPANASLSALVHPTEEGQGTRGAILQGDMLYYYDYENSIYVHAEGSVAVNITESAAGSDAASGGTTRTLVTVETTLVE